MKIDTLLVFTLLASFCSCEVTHLRKESQTKPARNLYENLTSSYLLGDTIDSTDTSHLSLLISQQKAMDNFKIVGTWLSDVEEKLDDLRDSVNRRISDMAIGL